MKVTQNTNQAIENKYSITTTMLPPDAPALYAVHAGYAGIHGLLQIFTEDLKELELNFYPADFMSFYEDFRVREIEADLASAETIDPAFYWIEGKSCWIRVCFEAHESYYEWSCYTARDNIPYYKIYFMNQ